MDKLSHKENNKTKLLIIGIIMNCAGTEKSFLAFANSLDYSKYDVTLLLAKREGKLLDKIPPQIKIITMDERYADMFLLSGKNAIRTIFNCFVKHNPFTIFQLIPYFLKICIFKSKRSDIATRMWCDLMKKAPRLPGKYDVAAAYWGDRTMFYMCDKVDAKKKIAWLHFDYGNPRREDKLYLSYFERCDKIVTVSQKVNDALCDHLPQIADRCTVIENINSSSAIKELAECGNSFPDKEYSGKRIVTVARICEQKGQDIALKVLKKLCDEGYDVRWYFIGNGDDNDILEFKASAVSMGIADRAIYLGPTDNPYRYINDCDVFVLTSRYEGKPITVEEAKILCKPIVVTNYLSATEQLENGKFGMVCKIDEDDVFLAVRRLLNDDQKRSALEQTLAAADFDNTSEMEKFYSICEN